MNLRTISISLSSALLASSVNAADTTKRTQRLDGYTLDLQGPVHVTESPMPLPLPTEVDVYITGPRVYIDKSDTPWGLWKNPPLWSSTNLTEITALISALQVTDNTERISQVSRRAGYTYHLLLIQKQTKTVMHFRVFETTEIKTSWCDVFPRSDTGLGYFNNRIGSWLRSHLPTNSLPSQAAAGTSDAPK